MELSNIPRKVLQMYPSDGIPFYYSLKAFQNWKVSGGFLKRPDPFKIVYIDPQEILHNSLNRFSYISDRSMYYDCGTIAPGDWDLSSQKFKEHTIYPSEDPKNTIYSSLKMRFENGSEWPDTPLIKYWFKLVRDGKIASHGGRTESDILHRCAKIDTLYNGILVNGYQSKRDLLKFSGSTAQKLKNPHLFRFLYDEVVVNIGRTGEFLFVGGHHRLSIALIQGIQKIPVRIFVRHKEWQERRDEIWNSRKGISRDLVHPDFEDLKIFSS